MGVVYRYDLAGKVLSVTRADGQSIAAGYDGLDRLVSVTAGATLTFRPNGPVAGATDATNNLTAYGYDGFDRLVQVTYPSPAQGSQAANPGDYERSTLDANGGGGDAVRL